MIVRETVRAALGQTFGCVNPHFSFFIPKWLRNKMLTMSIEPGAHMIGAKVLWHDPSSRVQDQAEIRRERLLVLRPPRRRRIQPVGPLTRRTPRVSSTEPRSRFKILLVRARTS